MQQRVIVTAKHYCRVQVKGIFKHLMSNPNPPAKITNFVTKNVIVSSVVAVLSILILGSVVAQAFGPENLKPFKVAKSESSSSSSLNSSTSSDSYSVSSSSVSSTSSTASSTATASTIKTQTYTNPYFPDFKLVYPEDWKFETTTSSSQYKNLINRKLILTKNSYSLVVGFYATAIADGCGGSGFVIKADLLPGGITKYIVRGPDEKDDQGSAIYGKNSIGCPFDQFLVSNIKAGDFADYKNVASSISSLPTKDFVVYNFQISSSKVNNNQPQSILRNDPIIKEIDQIISQSSFK